MKKVCQSAQGLFVDTRFSSSKNGLSTCLPLSPGLTSGLPLKLPMWLSYFLTKCRNTLLRSFKKRFNFQHVPSVSYTLCTVCANDERRNNIFPFRSYVELLGVRPQWGCQARWCSVPPQVTGERNFPASNKKPRSLRSLQSL